MIRRRGPGVLVLAMLLATTWTLAIEASEQKWRYIIHLKSGATVDADHARETESQVEYEAGGGKISIPRATVERIERVAVVEPARPAGPVPPLTAGPQPPPDQLPVAAQPESPGGGLVAGIMEKIRSLAGGLLGRSDTGAGQEAGKAPAASAGSPATGGPSPVPEGMEDVRAEAQVARQKLEAQAREQERLSVGFVGTVLLGAGGLLALFLLKFLWNLLFGRVK